MINLMSIRNFSRRIFFCILAAASMLIFSESVPDATANQIGREWLDVVPFKQAVREVEAMPRGGYDCYVEGDGEEEPPVYKSEAERIAAEKQQEEQALADAQYVVDCEKSSAAEAEAFSLASKNFNAHWLPVINKAVQQGDPVAEVILRLCETTSVLDRSGVAADCSESDADKKIARERLEAIGFQPALHGYSNTDRADIYRLCGNNDRECRISSETERLKRVLEVMKSGYLYEAGRAFWDTTCPFGSYKYQNENEARLGIDCNYYLYLVRSILQAADQAYVLSLTTEKLDLPRKNANYGVWDRTPDRARMEIDSDTIVFNTKAQIRKDLEQEPRWSVFLLQREIEDKALNGKVTGCDYSANKSPQASASQIEAGTPITRE